LDFTEARDSKWQWHQTDKYASTPPLTFLQAGCPSCHPTNSVKALKTHKQKHKRRQNFKTVKNTNNYATKHNDWSDFINESLV